MKKAGIIKLHNKKSNVFIVANLSRKAVIPCAERLIALLKKHKIGIAMDLSARETFTEAEVEAMLAYYDLAAELPEVKRWYDGYLFNETEIYNPWSILKYVNDRKDHVTEFALPYWSNTSSNSIVREMVGEADEMAKADLETLINDGTIEKPVHEDITYGDIHQSQDNLWNFLFFTGYLKKVGEQKDGNNLKLEMKIPNIEIATIYENSISY